MSTVTITYFEKIYQILIAKILSKYLSLFSVFSKITKMDKVAVHRCCRYAEKNPESHNKTSAIEYFVSKSASCLTATLLKENSIAVIFQ